MFGKVNIYNEYNNVKKNKIHNIKKISVIIPNYNYEKYIIERIDSILFQTYPIFELIILDDASTDNSVNIIDEKIDLIKSDDKYKFEIKFIKNSKNSGCVFSQWQKAFEYAKGDYIWIAEADDSSSPYFLEEMVNAYEREPNIVLAYCESTRIDENNRIIRKKSDDLYDMCKCKDWLKSYISNGNDEIINHLSVTNTILNVSSVLWKKGNYNKVFEEAKSYKVAGDWYIYSKILENGKISFNEKPLNYFRKHKVSVSTVVRAELEYSEICKIQNDIKSRYNLDLNILKKQEMRRNITRKLITNYDSQNDTIIKAKIAFVMPIPGKGSGGHRTIMNKVNYLNENNYKCDIYIPDNGRIIAKDMKRKICNYYGDTLSDVYVSNVIEKKYDMIFATGNNTVDMVINSNCENKMYFVQDFEPWFYAMGEDYIKAENTYRNDLIKITIGKFLAYKMLNEYNGNVCHFDFTADLKKYKILPNIKKEKAICFIFQPNKPRRCDKLGIDALKLVKKAIPDVKIYLYGSNEKNTLGLSCENLKVISQEECNILYNKCSVGLCISASNPSRIPFEMMASGLPVVEIYKENNLFDIPNEAAILANPSPDAIASAILKIINNQDIQKRMSEKAQIYMKKFNSDDEQKEFLQIVESCLNNTIVFDKRENINKLYNEQKFETDTNVSYIYRNLSKDTNIKYKKINNLIRYINKIKYFPTIIVNKMYKILNRKDRN